MLRWSGGWIFQQEGGKRVNKRVVSEVPLELQEETPRKIWSLWSSIECRVKFCCWVWGINMELIAPYMVFKALSLDGA